MLNVAHCSSVVECLLSMYVTLGPVFSTTTITPSQYFHTKLFFKDNNCVSLKQNMVGLHTRKCSSAIIRILVVDNSVGKRMCSAHYSLLILLVITPCCRFKIGASTNLRI